MNIVIISSSILGQAARCISGALNTRHISLDEETLTDVMYTLNRVLSDETDDATSGLPANVTRVNETPLLPWTGNEEDTDGKLTWALEIFKLELAERVDDLEMVLDGGRRTRIGETHAVFCKLLEQR